VIEARLHASIDALREELRRRHGATHLEVEIVADPHSRRVVVAGEVLVHRLIRIVQARLGPEVPSGWTVDVSGLRAWSGGPWRAPPGRVPLHGRRGSDVPCTVLRIEDGPVQELAGGEDDEWLVRAMDGTAGWLSGVLGERVEAPILPVPRAAAASAVVGVASAYLGVPYRLGGTDEEALDCSGLVQRVLRCSHALVVPRHSTDQRAIDPRSGAPPEGAGHLAFVWTASEAMCHVGVCTDVAVIHASRSRGRVVEDPRAAFFAAATRIDHVPFDALITFGRRVAGHPSLVAAGFVLGG
jgi:cell wall-associated NlpC family hydrolase